MNKFLIKNSEVSENAVHGIWGPELSCWSRKTDDLVIDCIEFLLNCEVLFRWTDNKMEVLNPSGSILEGSQCQQCSPPMELKSHIDIHFQKDFANMPLFLFLLSWFPLKIFSSKKKKKKIFSWPYEIANNTQPFILHCHLLFILLVLLHSQGRGFSGSVCFLSFVYTSVLPHMQWVSSSYARRSVCASWTVFAHLLFLLQWIQVCQDLFSAQHQCLDSTIICAHPAQTFLKSSCILS